MFNYKVGQKYLTKSGSEETVTSVGIQNGKVWAFIGDNSGGNFYDEQGKSDNKTVNMDLVEILGNK